VDSALCGVVGEETGRSFGFPTQVLPLLKEVSFAYDTQRRQYHSTKILEKLAEAAPPLAIKVIGIATVDLFIPILTHVYGEAQLGGKACIISTFRLRENPHKGTGRVSLKERAVKEALHELGHTFKLKHCPEHSCIMHYCRSVADVDRKTAGFCRHCRVMVEDELKRTQPHVRR
jgi:archaemetzincin